MTRVDFPTLSLVRLPLFCGRTCLLTSFVVHCRIQLCRSHSPPREGRHSGVRRQASPQERQGLGCLQHRALFRPRSPWPTGQVQTGHTAWQLPWRVSP